MATIGKDLGLFTLAVVFFSVLVILKFVIDDFGVLSIMFSVTVNWMIMYCKLRIQIEACKNFAGRNEEET